MKDYIQGMALIIAAGLILASCASPAQKKLQEGDVYFGKQDWGRAIVSYSLAGELDPQIKPVKQIAAAYTGKAGQSFEKGDYESAVFNYEKAVSFDPETRVPFDIGYARYRVALQYIDSGRYGEALQVLSAAINGGYGDSKAYLARAQVYNMLGMYSGAIGDATACLDIDSRSAGAYLERGCAFLATSEYKKTVSDLTSAIGLDASLKDAYYYRGLAFKETGEFNHAINDFKRAVELAPDSTAALVQLGRSHYLATGYYAAIEQFTRAIELNRSDVAVAFNDRAVCLGRTGEYNAAVSDLRVLIKMKPAFPLAYYNLGVVYMKMVQPPPGVDNLDTYLCLDIADKFGCRELAMGWRWHNIEYNLCCINRAVSGSVLDRCNRILTENSGSGTIPFENGSLYFGSENDLYY